MTYNSYLLLLFLYLLPCALFAQTQLDTVACCATINTHRSCGDYKNKPTTLLAYLKQDTSQNVALFSHISNRHQLEELEGVYRVDDAVVWESGATRLLLQTASVVVEEAYTIGFTSLAEFGGKDSIITTLNGKREHGWRATSTTRATVKRLDGCTLNGQPLDATPIDHLLFPNFTQTCYSLKPIAAYWSADRAFIYVYVFGTPDLRHGNLGDRGQKGSYMAKVIVDMQQQKIVGALTVGGYPLSLYQWFCTGFIGF